MWSVAGMQRRASVPASISAGGAGDVHTVGVAAQAQHRHHAADLELITVRLISEKVAAHISAGSETARHCIIGIALCTIPTVSLCKHQPHGILQDLVERSAQAVLGEAIAADQPLMAAGLDSVGAQELQQGLANALGLSGLPATLVYDHPTITALATHLHVLVMSNVAGPADAAAAAMRTPRRVWRSGPAAAVLGVSGVCSGQPLSTLILR